jgi:hypothetical protein
MNWFYLIGAVLFIHAPRAEPVILLPNRFAVPVCTDRNLSPKYLKVGNPVEIKVAYDLRWQGCLVFRGGTPVTATIIEAHGPGVLGRPSLIVLDVQSTVAVD